MKTNQNVGMSTPSPTTRLQVDQRGQTPDKKVEEVVKEFWNKFSMYDLGYRGEGDEVEAWLRTTFTQYHQDRMNELEEKIEGMKIEEQMADWAKEHQKIGFNQALTEALTIIKSSK